MIAFPATSQKRYIIGKDTIVGYTHLENRSIAMLLVKGDRAMYNNSKDSVIIKSLEVDKLILQDKINNYVSSETLYKAQISTLNADLQKCISDKNYSHRWAARWRNGCITVSLLGTILYLLK